MLTDIHADTSQFVTISEAKIHDKNFLQHLNPVKGSMIVFDKAYSYYLQLAKWTSSGVNFVCRLKDNANAATRKFNSSRIAFTLPFSC
jgi:hypothetical protein